MVTGLNKIKGFDITEHEKSKRIIEIKINDDVLKKLIFPFNKFDITALEYKPFTRFTIAKSLDDLTSNKLSELINAKDSSRPLFRVLSSLENVEANKPWFSPLPSFMLK